MCGGDDHLTWKCPVSLKACRGLRTTGGVDNRLFCIIDQIDMDPQTIIVDQFTTTMASVQEVIDSLNQKPDTQTTISKNVHARMDRLEQQIKQIRMLDSSVAWDDSDGIPVANLPAEFRMPEINRYTNIGCLCIHLILYSTIMRAYGLDET
ncbi:hypothetical protein CK203_027711 [Vitis vinifera]|uniref:Uncharacterized protein n=1 Tax=Vitis vinifera TaxID=29760 RepID=A0A438IH35_VITVI|nr:hypothetical protein CK203_108597 [Vitis vinifera]RVW96041.1 hypothetical protein CK203_027711 [Vitis vinifera]